MERHEIRYRGEWLGVHPSREAAEVHAREHHGWGRSAEQVAAEKLHNTSSGREGCKRADHHVEDLENLTIEPERPLHLLCNGSFVDSFHTSEAAQDRQDQLSADLRANPQLRRRMTSAKIEEHIAQCFHVSTPEERAQAETENATRGPQS